MTQVTAKKEYIKDEQGSYVVPYVNPLSNTELGVAKVDGVTINASADGTISANVSSEWGEITGNITEQKDLINLLGDKSNTSLDNLTSTGNAKFQYAPFSINNGAVDSNGKNATLSVPSIVQYKKYNFTEYGTITKNEGLISGFSQGTSGNRVYSTLYINYNSLTSFELQVEFTTNSDVSTKQNIIGGANQTYDPIQVYIQSGNIIIGLNNEANKTTIGTATANTTYVVKIIYNNGWTYYLNGATAGTSSYSKNNLGTDYLGFGVEYSSNSRTYPFLGSINMNNAYYIIDDNSSWFGVIEGTSSDYDFQLGASGSVIYCTPCTITTCDGRTNKFNSSVYYELSGETDGDYIIFKDFADGSISIVLSSDYSIGITGSTNYFLNISTTPANLYINGSINNDLVAIGTCTVSNNSITTVTNKYFNACPYHRDLVDSYKNGANYYNIYSNGDCIQGGSLPNTTASSSYTLSFLKEFKDDSYSIYKMYGSSSNSSANFYFLGFYNKTRTSATTYVSINNVSNWVAIGKVF